MLETELKKMPLLERPRPFVDPPAQAQEVCRLGAQTPRPHEPIQPEHSDEAPALHGLAPTEQVMPRSRLDPVSLVVHLVFILSGVSALIYQLVWQRSLMMIYGSNVESVAMVVTAFMLGLGLGSVAGGAVSRFQRIPLVLLFSGAELLIGLYGVFSLRLFHWVGGYTLRAGAIETGFLAFGLVFIPTLFMGATLPLLVAWRVNATRHVGHSVSGLYFVNTLGAGLGAFSGAFIFLRNSGLSGSVNMAALLNVVAAVSILLVWGLRRKKA